MNSEIEGRVEIEDGTVLLRPGETPDHLFLIRSGHVALDPEGISRRFVFGPGTVIGLSWIIDEKIAQTYESEIVAVGRVTADLLDARMVKEQLAGLSPRMRVCLVSMIRQIHMVVATENQTDERLSRLLKKSARELDHLLEVRDAETRSPRVDPLAEALGEVERETRRGDEL